MARPRQRNTTGTAPAASGRARSIAALREAARSCRDCPLWKDATQTVFGEGPQRASVMLVGEQPGDQEDLQGRPFVGPAGRLLDKALTETGIERSSLYVTNAVKHFKFLMRGKRRLHKTPGQLEIAACHQWLASEIASLQPGLIVAMGATAAHAVLGRATAIEANRGRVVKSEGGADIVVTVHPSYLLRIRPPDRDLAYRRFVADLRLMRPYLNRASRPSRTRKASAAVGDRPAAH